MVFQLQLARNINATPIIRDYVVDRERLRMGEEIPHPDVRESPREGGTALIDQTGRYRGARACPLGETFCFTGPNPMSASGRGCVKTCTDEKVIESFSSSARRRTPLEACRVRFVEAGGTSN